MKKMRKVLAFVLATSLVMSSLCTSAFADTTESNDLVAKTAVENEDDSYTVNLRVPGQDGVEVHDEVIIMMDGSYSGDDEWPSARKSILEIGDTVLNGSGTTKLSLMTFGMGDNMVVEAVSSVEELDAELTEKPGGLLYGRSSTNCEAGFTGVQEYVEAHAGELDEVFVIYITDGEVNTDETPRVFDNWQTIATRFGALDVALEAFCGTVDAGVYPDALIDVFGDRFDGMSKEEIIAAAFDGTTISDEEMLAFGDQLWEDVYAYSGLTLGAEYPVSDVERAFVKYDKEKGTFIQDVFYYTIYGSSYVTYGDKWSRTPMAATNLAQMVDHLYMVDTNGTSNWMVPNTTADPAKNVVGDNISFVSNANVADLLVALGEDLTNIVKTPFNDVVIEDYMSKWVNIDLDSIRIIDSAADEVIWTVTDGWLISDNIPTAAEPPVIVTEVPASEYEAGGDAVIGNTNGTIYKLTWYVKDGALLRTENYTLAYEVTVDTEEDGFVYDTDYPANGTTTVEYTDEDGNRKEEDIKVPNVSAEDTKKPLPEDEFIIDEEDEEDERQPLPEDEFIIEEEPEQAPETGDETPIMLLLIIAAISLGSFVTLYSRKK